MVSLNYMGRSKSRAKLYNARFTNDFLDSVPKAQATKGNIDRVDLMRIKKFCASEGNINR